MVNFKTQTLHEIYQTTHFYPAFSSGCLLWYTEPATALYASIFSETTVSATHIKNGKLMSDALPIQFNVDADGKIQNI